MWKSTLRKIRFCSLVENPSRKISSSLGVPSLKVVSSSWTEAVSCFSEATSSSSALSRSDMTAKNFNSKCGVDGRRWNEKQGLCGTETKSRTGGRCNGSSEYNKSEHDASQEATRVYKPRTAGQARNPTLPAVEALFRHCPSDFNVLSRYLRRHKGDVDQGRGRPCLGKTRGLSMRPQVYPRPPSRQADRTLVGYESPFSGGVGNDWIT